MNKETKCVIDNLTLEKGRLRLFIQIFARLQMFEGVGVANQTNAFRRNWHRYKGKLNRKTLKQSEFME